LSPKNATRMPELCYTYAEKTLHVCRILEGFCYTYAEKTLHVCRFTQEKFVISDFESILLHVCRIYALSEGPNLLHVCRIFTLRRNAHLLHVCRNNTVFKRSVPLV